MRKSSSDLHERMQTSRNSVQCEFVSVQREMEGVPYKIGVGSLMYAMVDTRVDLAFAVSMVSQFMSKAGPPYWMVVKRIIKYLKGTLAFKLCLRDKNITLRGICIVKWEGEANDWQSTMGYVFFCWCWSHFVEMQETTNDCIVYDGDGVHDHLPLYEKMI